MWEGDYREKTPSGKRNDWAEHAHCQSINRQWAKQDMYILRLA